MKSIVTTYHGPTNNRGSRIIADDGDGNRINLSYEPAGSSEDNHQAACRALCKKMKWRGRLQGGTRCKNRKIDCTVWNWINKADQITV